MQDADALGMALGRLAATLTLDKAAALLRRGRRRTRAHMTDAEHKPKAKTPLGKVRHLVSKKKRRYTQDGFDLDLSYVTPRLIAMGFPSVGTEACYRNPAKQTRQFIEQFHRGQCKVYNLCAEADRVYSPALLGLTALCYERHGTYDHNPCPLALIAPFCRSVEAWLAEDERNVVAVHCKAGKGRTRVALAGCKRLG